MVTFLIILHVVVSVSLIMIVLLQTGKGADMGAAFGGSSQTVFGGTGPAPFLGKVTTIAAVIFMITSLSLAYLSSNPLGGSIVEDVKTAAPPPVAESPAGNVGTGEGVDTAAQPVGAAPAEETAPITGKVDITPVKEKAPETKK